MSQITNGIINLNKPAEWTSHDCVAVLRGLLKIKRIGHTGTLDPMATGVLPICIGTSTRIMEYLDLDFKTYRCEMKLGIETDTLDIWGETVSSTVVSGITAEMVEAAFLPFKGQISQIPPKYSAIKVDGRKLYQYARAGEDVTIKPRQVFIKELEIEEIDLDQGCVSFRITCSKGTYIRSICRDVGDALGCGGVMSSLVRTASGCFLLEDAIDIKALREMEPEEIKGKIKQTDYPLVHFGKALVSPERGRFFCNGGHLKGEDVEIERRPKYETEQGHIPIREEYRHAYNMYMRSEEGDTFLGVAFYNGKFVADKVFYRGRNDENI